MTVAFRQGYGEDCHTADRDSVWGIIIVEFAS